MTKSKGGILDTFKTIIWALLIAGIFRTLFFQPFWIPSGSMKDTLLIGDFLFVNKMAYGYSRYSCPLGLCPFEGRILSSEPQRGDVAVFRHPVSGADFIKRVVGLPGDQIQFKNGIIHLNGQEVPQVPNGVLSEPYAPQGSLGNLPRCQNRPLTEGGICLKERATERMPGARAEYSVLNIDVNGYADNTDIFTVPKGHYFFVGDNRDNSQDSRFSQAIGGVGFVPADNLIGRADRVMFSSAGRSLLFFWTWRTDRLFKAVQ